MWYVLQRRFLPRVERMNGSALAARLICVAILALCFVCPGKASASSCSMPATTNLSVTYTGSDLSNADTKSLSCTGFTNGATYYVCLDGSAYPGNGGTTETPYRQLELGYTMNSANWQIYTTSGAAITSQTVIATVTGDQLNAGTAPVTLTYKFPRQNLAIGTYTTGSSSLFVYFIYPSAGCTGTMVTTVVQYFNYTVIVSATCSALTTTNLDFGAIASTAAAAVATGAISVTCGSGLAYQVFMGSGVNASGGVSRMNSGTNYLSYALYSDAARTTAWTSTQGVSATGTGNAQAYSVYGTIPVQTIPATGSYSDTVVVTLRF